MDCDEIPSRRSHLRPAARRGRLLQRHSSKIGDIVNQCAVGRLAKRASLSIISPVLSDGHNMGGKRHTSGLSMPLRAPRTLTRRAPLATAPAAQRCPRRPAAAALEHDRAHALLQMEDLAGATELCAGPIRQACLLPGEPVGEKRDCLCVNLRRVPLQDGGEIGLALVPARAGLPAMPLEKRRCRSERVGGIVDEVWRPRSIGRRRVHEIGGWHELRLADLARPGAAQQRAAASRCRGRRAIASISSARKRCARRQSQARVARAL